MSLKVLDGSGNPQWFATSGTGTIGSPFLTVQSCVVAIGAVLPSNVLVIGGSDGTDARALRLDASGNLNGLPLPTGAATEAGHLATIDTSTARIPAQGQALAASSLPVVLTAIQVTALTPPAAITGFALDATLSTNTGSLTETAPVTDTASSGLNGRLQRIAQRLTSLITALGSPFQAGGSIGNTTFAATQATGTNLHTVVDSGTITTVTTVTTVSSVTAIAGALPAGTNTIGAVTTVAGTTGGTTPYVLQQSANSNNSTSVQASASTLYGLEAFNLAAYPVYIKFFNKASAPTPGSDTVVKSIMVPANSTAANGAGVVISWDKGVAFGTGLAFAIVKGQANSDNTSVASGDCTLNLDYK